MSKPMLMGDVEARRRTTLLDQQGLGASPCAGPNSALWRASWRDALKFQYSPLVRGCGQPMVDSAVTAAQRNLAIEMAGFNARTKTLRPFGDIGEFQRYQIRQKADRTIAKLAPLLGGCTVYRLTLTVSSKVRPCRVDHARALRSAATVMFGEIRGLCIGYAAALHVDAVDRLHWDVTVLVRNPGIPAFEHAVKHNIHATGWRMAGRQRAYSCHRRRQGTTHRDLERSIDYTLKHDRYRRHPGRTLASIRALGIARASGFGQVTKSMLGARAKSAAKPLTQNANQVSIPVAVNGVRNPMTVKGTPPRVSSQVGSQAPCGKKTKRKRSGRPGPRPKSAGKWYRRNRVDRVKQAAGARPQLATPSVPTAPRKRVSGVLTRLGNWLATGTTHPRYVVFEAESASPSKARMPSPRAVQRQVRLDARRHPWLAYRQHRNGPGLGELVGDAIRALEAALQPEVSMMIEVQAQGPAGTSQRASFRLSAQFPRVAPELVPMCRDGADRGEESVSGGGGLAAQLREMFPDQGHHRPFRQDDLCSRALPPWEDGRHVTGRNADSCCRRAPQLMADKGPRQARVLKRNANVLRTGSRIEHAKADLPVAAPAADPAQTLRRRRGVDRHFYMVDKPWHHALPTTGTSPRLRSPAS